METIHQFTLEDAKSSYGEENGLQFIWVLRMQHYRFNLLFSLDLRQKQNFLKTDYKSRKECVCVQETHQRNTSPVNAKLNEMLIQI